MKLDEVIAEDTGLGAAVMEFATFIEMMEEHSKPSEIQGMQRVGAHLIKNGLHLELKNLQGTSMLGSCSFVGQFFHVDLPQWNSTKKTRVNICKIGTAEPYTNMTLGIAAKMDVKALESGFKALRAAELHLAVYLK